MSRSGARWPSVFARPGVLREPAASAGTRMTHAGSRPGVLMVTGAYFPELSGGGLQARAVVQALQSHVDFLVLTTSLERALPAHASEAGVPIRRIPVRVGHPGSEILAAVKTVLFFLRARRRFDIVNVHGFSRKSILLHHLARLTGKRFILTLQTGGHDEPAAARALGRRAFRAYADADLVISVSRGLSQAYSAGGLPASKLRDVPNAVDTDRFRPPAPGERAALRVELGLPADRPIVLFVGYFSRDKRPDVLYDAWQRLDRRTSPSTLVFVGATDSSYQEVDSALAADLRRRIAADGCRDAVLFVEPTRAIEKYYRACDIYVLTSCREGLPIALLEAMSSGLAPVATRLEGSTDTIIEHGRSGLLVEVEDISGFSSAMQRLIADPSDARRLGHEARQCVLDRYAIHQVAPRWLAAYQEVLDGTPAR
jgi:glycosyltransferase involved in cell wall biosynthesis